MTFTYAESIRPRLRRIASPFSGGPSGEMARALGPAACLAAVVASALPASTPLAVLLALAVFCPAGLIAARRVRRDFPHDRLGLCNYVTLLRLALVSALTAPLLAGGYLSWALVGLAVVALSLDGLDGWLARRQGRVSPFGARFDVEVDSLFAFVLALNAAFATELGPAVLILGVPRYAFLLAMRFLPWMRGELPERFSRKVICVLQITALIVLQVPGLPPLAGAAIATGVAIALIWSFAWDLSWLWRRRG